VFSTGGGLNIGGQSIFGSTANKPNMFGTGTGMFNTGGFGVGSTFTTGTGLGTSVSLGGNPLLGGLVWIPSRTEPYEISHFQYLRLTIKHDLTY
jgi:hypothetical protein